MAMSAKLRVLVVDDVRDMAQTIANDDIRRDEGLPEISRAHR